MIDWTGISDRLPTGIGDRLHRNAHSGRLTEQPGCRCVRAFSVSRPAMLWVGTRTPHSTRWTSSRHCASVGGMEVQNQVAPQPAGRSCPTSKPRFPPRSHAPWPGRHLLRSVGHAQAPGSPTDSAADFSLSAPRAPTLTVDARAGSFPVAIFGAYTVRARSRAVTSHRSLTLPPAATHAWECRAEVGQMWVGIAISTSPGR